MAHSTALVLRHLRGMGRKDTTTAEQIQTPDSLAMPANTEPTTAERNGASSRETISTEKEVNIEAGQKAETSGPSPAGVVKAPGMAPPEAGPPGFGGPPIEYPQGIKLYSNILSLYLAGFLTALVSTSGKHFKRNKY
jgi:hypothetical protein